MCKELLMNWMGTIGRYVRQQLPYRGKYAPTPSSHERIITTPGHARLGHVPMVALLRVRNEGLILKDTLDHIAGFADAIVAYDDNSTDDTLEILVNHPAVSFVVQNLLWLPAINDRLLCETRHRGLIYNLARRFYKFDWCFCCDADERYLGDIKDFPSSSDASGVDGVRIRLFDAYMTDNDLAPFEKGRELINFRRWFGPECRDILMMWRNLPSVKFKGLDSREPSVKGNIISAFHCQHYGKSISIDHWQETCLYYMNHFPYDTYGKKWEARLGHAIHGASDFGRQLYKWGDELFANATSEF